MSTTKTFADYGVEQTLCDSLAEVGITTPFPIQEMTLPLALNGADIIGQARTGTGKTLGFGLPMLQRIDTGQGLGVLVVVPTRELCLQVAEDLTQAGAKKGVEVIAVYGGKAIQPQVDAISGGAHLVVGTPGRLLDLARRGVLDLSTCRGLVLDEADEMLDLGFLPDVEALIEMCADDRQTLLFSATMPAQVVSLARRYMTKPTFMRAEVEEARIAPETRQYFFSCHRMDKPAVLARILTTPNRGLCVVFCRTKRMADTLAEELRDRDVAAQAIHSDLRQEARERALRKFRDGKTTVLCATEVAARGLDIDDVTHVVNYDCPDDHKMYLHRIGRTGRAGADGVAITLAVWNELPRLEMIRRDLDIDEEVHEVFSTSPLLDELFDLEPRSQKPKVPSPPQARGGKRSRRQRGRQNRPPAGDRPKSSTRDRNGSSGRERRRTKTVNTATAEEPATRMSPSSGAPEGTAAGSQRRRRRRSEPHGDRTPRGASEPSDTATSKETSTSEETAPDHTPRRGRKHGSRNDGAHKNGARKGGSRDQKRSGRSEKGPTRPGRPDRAGSAVDSDEARGDGRPRLTRKLEVQHLP